LMSILLSKFSKVAKLLRFWPVTVLEFHII
jgi:hypothetical protein